MENTEKSALELAEKEIAETGALSFPGRRRLWEAMGPLEPREQDSGTPRSLTGPLKKRAELALACAKKVSRIWCAFDGEDKRPRHLMKQTRAYLDGKISAEALSAESDVIDDFMIIVEDEGDSATAAALAAWDALVVALEDESLLEPWCADATDADLDPYDWDAAKNAAMAWRDAGSGGNPGKRAVREMKYWAWYLEEWARLLGAEDYRFPPRYIRAFQEKQAPARPVPQEVTLESFAGYMGGRYQFHTYASLREGYDREPGTYTVSLWFDGDRGICPVCYKETELVDIVHGDCCLWEIPLPGGRKLEVHRIMPNFSCPDHPEIPFIFPPSAELVSNYNAALKDYWKGPGRKQAFVEQLENRLPRMLNIQGVEVEYLANHWEELHLTNAGWVDREMEQYAFDVAPFLPNFFLHSCTLEQYFRYYPDQVRRLEDGSIEIELFRLWVRIWMDEAGRPKRAMLTTRFAIWVAGKPDKNPFLPKLLAELRGMTPEQVKESLRTAKPVSRDYELEPLSGLTRPEAIRFQATLEAGGVECRILPTPIAQQG
ncbi:Imm5 family immunity protein [uncultured Acetatifactor sp.]|uniref:Imm5 family immunity protein n=1 Tax=uncultured Acetatifactor sp. TaxID=1671927 RepID=UPI002607CBF6|nr:Imm5 family immunity protein [uncultured Acetatifactor sp.]